jgi:hypothetical protein
VACVYSGLGAADEAIDPLEKAVPHGFTDKDWILHDADLDSLPGHERFQVLLNRF